MRLSRVDDLALAPARRVDTAVRAAEGARRNQGRPGAIDRIVGRYELRPDFVIAVRREGDRILTQATGQDVFEIFPETELEYLRKRRSTRSSRSVATRRAT